MTASPMHLSTEAAVLSHDRPDIREERIYEVEAFLWRQVFGHLCDERMSENSTTISRSV